MNNENKIKLKKIINNLDDNSLKIRFKTFLLNTYEYNLYFSLNDSLNDLNSVYGSGEKYKTIHKNINKVEEFIISQLYNSYYNYNNSINNRLENSINELKEKIQASINKGWKNTEIYEEKISELKEEILNSSPNDFITSYISLLNDMTSLKKENDIESYNDALTDFLDTYYLGDKKLFTKYNEIFLNNSYILKKQKLQNNKLKKSLNKHIKYCKIYENYLKTLKNLESFMITKQTNQMTKDIWFNQYKDDILEICSNELSTKSIDILYHISLSKDIHCTINMWIIPFESAFKNKEVLKSPDNWGKLIYCKKKSTTDIDTLKTNIDAKISKIDFNEADKLYQIYQDFKKETY